MTNENRMTIGVHELNTLNEWLTRLNCNIASIELRQGNEPGIGSAITAYVETNDDEGYFRLLSVSKTDLDRAHSETIEAVKRLTEQNVQQQ